MELFDLILVHDTIRKSDPRLCVRDIEKEVEFGGI